MATICTTTTSTITETETVQQQTSQTLCLKLEKPTRSRRVNWSENTIDNEFLGRKKSKCCCIYEKPHNWNESSSDDDNEDKDCKHCIGHRKADFNKEKAKVVSEPNIRTETI
jgi:protein phosphatase 1 regulatory subunit 11